MSLTPDRIAAIRGGTHARIDLDRYEQNIRLLKQLAGPDRAFMAVIKANAYGHGAIACGQAAERAGVDYLAVARAGEGIQLRQAGITAPILVLGPPQTGLVDRAIELDLTLTVATSEGADAIVSAAGRASTTARVHLKLDTGLHRYGADPDLALTLVRRLAADERIDLEGVYAHFSSADEADLAPTLQQIERAESALEELLATGSTFRYIHLPNSAATLRGQMGPSNLARAGLATYGLRPSGDLALPAGIGPVMTIHSKLARVFELPAGEGVSYGLTYRASAPEWAATVPVGYADGLPRSLSNQGWFLANGTRCPIRGRISMDQTVIGLPERMDEGTDVEILGDGSNESMTADTIAALHGTINYEIVAGVATRVPRLYLRDGKPSAWIDTLLGESEGL